MATRTQNAQTRRGGADRLGVLALAALALGVGLVLPLLMTATAKAATYVIPQTVVETRQNLMASPTPSIVRTGALAYCQSTDVPSNMDTAIEANPAGLSGNYDIRASVTASFLSTTAGQNKSGIAVALDGVVVPGSQRLGYTLSGSSIPTTLSTNVYIDDVDVSQQHQLDLLACSTHGTNLQAADLTFTIEGQTNHTVEVPESTGEQASIDTQDVEDNLIFVAGLIAASIAAFPLTRAFQL